MIYLRRLAPGWARGKKSPSALAKNHNCIYMLRLRAESTS